MVSIKSFFLPAGSAALGLCLMSSALVVGCETSRRGGGGGNGDDNDDTSQSDVLLAEPGEIDFGYTEALAFSAEQDVLLTNQSGDVLQIEAIRISDEGTTNEFSLQLLPAQLPLALGGGGLPGFP